MFLFGSKKTEMVAPGDALPGRGAPIPTERTHHVSGVDIGEVPGGMEVALFGLGCFWGAERMFWKVPGVHSTAVGYAGGFTPNPTYEEVCSGRTGHNEVVRVVHDPRAPCPTRSCCASSGRGTTRRRGCGRATTGARSTAPAST